MKTFAELKQDDVIYHINSDDTIRILYFNSYCHDGFRYRTTKKLGLIFEAFYRGPLDVYEIAESYATNKDTLLDLIKNRYIRSLINYTHQILALKSYFKINMKKGRYDLIDIYKSEIKERKRAIKIKREKYKTELEKIKNYD